MSRNNLPHIILGTLGLCIVSAGLGVGLGTYTTSGIDPFYAHGGQATAAVADAGDRPEFAFADEASSPTR